MSLKGTLLLTLMCLQKTKLSNFVIQSLLDSALNTDFIAKSKLLVVTDGLQGIISGCGVCHIGLAQISRQACFSLQIQLIKIRKQNTRHQILFSRGTHGC